MAGKFVPPTIGELRTLVCAERFVDQPNGSGGQDGEWVPALEFFARIIFWKGGERDNAMRVQGFNYYSLTARYDSRLTEKHRLRFTNGGRERILNIRSVSNEEERNRWMTVSCEEGVGT